MSDLRNEIGNLWAAEKFDLLDALWESLEADGVLIPQTKEISARQKGASGCVDHRTISSHAWPADRDRQFARNRPRNTQASAKRCPDQDQIGYCCAGHDERGGKRYLIFQVW